MRGKYSHLIFVWCSLQSSLSDILEDPEDVTVVIGAPATLTCRVDIGYVKWFKDGVEMNIEDDEETSKILEKKDGSNIIH